MTMFRKSATEAGLNIESGKQAIKAEYRGQVSVGKNFSFTGSVDLDHHFSNAEPNANRWDYGVGFNHDDEFIIWIEPHPASSPKEVDIVLKKLKWLQSKLKSPGYEGFFKLTKATQEKGERPFRWLYKGKTSFRAGGKEARLLAQNGLNLPERRIRIG